MISRPLRLPVRSDTAPTANAASAQVNDSALADTDLSVAESEVGLHERPKEIQRVTVEEDDAEIETEERDQRHLVRRARPRLGWPVCHCDSPLALPVRSGPQYGKAAAC